MITIKVEKQARVTEDLNIEAPLFKKTIHSGGYLAVMDEQNFISILEFNGYLSITRRNASEMQQSDIMNIQSGKDITEQEFWSKFDEAVKGIREWHLTPEATV